MAVALSERMSASRDQDNAAIRAAVKERVAEEVSKMTGVEGSLNKAMKEKPVAHSARQPTVAQVAAATAELVIPAAIERVLPAAASDNSPVNKISIEELRVAVARALNMPQIRRAHALAVASTIKHLAADPAANGDCVTFCFPPASKLQRANNHAIKNFHRTNLAALNKRSHTWQHWEARRLSSRTRRRSTLRAWIVWTTPRWLRCPTPSTTGARWLGSVCMERRITAALGKACPAWIRASMSPWNSRTRSSRRPRKRACYRTLWHV